MNNRNNDSVKILLILIIISLIILAGLGSVYYFYQGSIRLKYVKANEYFNLGSVEDIRTGIQQFRYLAERYPRSKYAPKALYQIGYGYELIYNKTKDENKLDQAIHEYNRVYKSYRLSSESPMALFRIANINYIRKEYDEAQDKLDHILSEYVDTSLKPQIYTKKGFIYLETGEYRKALKYFNQKESLHDDMSFVGKAECYFKLGEYENGISAYEDFLRYRHTSNYGPQVVKAFLDNCYKYAKKLSDEKDYSRSNILYDKIITLFPDSKISEDALYCKGENYYVQKKYNEAVREFDKVVNNNFPHLDAAADFKLGMCYFEQGQFEESLKYYQKIIDFFPNSIYLNMANDWKRQSLREIKYRR